MRFVGARRRTIFLAMLLEASVVALLGSCFGTVLAWLASAATNAWYRRFDDTALTFSAVTAEIVVLGVGLSLALGLLSGRVRGRPAGADSPDGRVGEGLSPLWGLRNLARHPLWTALALLGITVASALLLDMVLLAGGLERSF